MVPLPRVKIRPWLTAVRRASVTNLPEGTEVELLPLDPGDWLDDADRAALHAALAQSQADVAAGRLINATDVLRGLRAR